MPFGSEVKIGYIASRKSEADAAGKLKSIIKVVSPLALLTPDLITLISSVCERYACKPWDLIKSAIPSRSAAVEAQFLVDRGSIGYQALASQDSAVVKNLSRQLTLIAEQDGLSLRIDELLTQISPNQQLLVIVPDERDLIKLSAHKFAVAPIILTSTDEKTKRYENFLRSRFEQPRLIIGTRSAIFTQLTPGSTVLLYNDGDE